MDCGQYISYPFVTQQWPQKQSPVCIEPQTNRVTALREMIRHGFRHLCVVDEGRIVGIFSMRELVGFVQDLFPTELSAED